MKMKKGLPVALAVACVWMGQHVGPGFAAGTMTAGFYVQYGLVGLITPFIAMGVLALAFYCVVEYTRKYDLHSYTDYAESFYNPYGKIFMVLFDISFLLVVICAVGAGFASVGSLFTRFFGINKWIAISGLIIATILLCLFGSELVRRASSYMMFIIGGIFLLIILLSFIFGDYDFGKSVQLSVETTTASTILTAVWKGFLYGCSQGGILLTISAVSETLSGPAESKKAALIGWLGNAILIVAMFVLLFGYTGVYNITAEELPVYSILERIDFSWLTFIYVLVVVLAVLSSAVSITFAGVARFKKYVKIKNEHMRSAIIAVVLLAAAVAASTLGLKTLAVKGNSIVGYVNIPCMILPAIFLGFYKLKHNKK